MNPINALGLKVVGLTSMIVLLLVGLFVAGRQVLLPAADEEQLLALPTIDETTRTDRDGDGLPDQFEPIYRTDATKSDTDGDGVGDYAEISQGRDPAVAGTSAVSQPLTGSAVVNPTTMTERYLASLPETIPREEILSPARLEAFVQLNKGALLPKLPPEMIRTTPAAGKAAVENYVNQISTLQNKALHPITNTNIEQAFQLQTQQKPEELTSVITKLRANVETLRQVEAPAETASLHEKLLGASQSLLDNTERLQQTNTDFVMGLIGSKNIEELATVWQEIAADVKNLEVKYGL